MQIILPNQVPPNRKVTYANFVCTMRPGKSEVYRVRMTVGGDRLDAYQDVRSPLVGLIDTKIHLNSTISNAHKGARYCTGDIKDFFLGSSMDTFQYMRVHKRYVPTAIIKEYNLIKKTSIQNVTFMWKFKKACMALRKLLSLPTNNFVTI